MKDGIDGASALQPEFHNKVKTNMVNVVEEPIQFGIIDSSTMANGAKEEENEVAKDSFPKDAAEEWPTPKQVHTFYLVKYRSYEDPKLKLKLEQADKEVQRKSQARFQILEALKAKRSERAQVVAQLKPLIGETKRYRAMMDEKIKEREPLQAALGELRSANNGSREKGIGICSSEKELDDLIHSLHYRIQHESNTLSVEKQLLKEIKQLEATREKVIANVAKKAKIEDSHGQKDFIQDRVKQIGSDLDGVWKEKQALRSQIKPLDDKLEAIDLEISSLEVELTSMTEKREKAYESLTELRKARDELEETLLHDQEHASEGLVQDAYKINNKCFYQNRSLLNSAKELAAKKDIQALEMLCHSETEEFISQWSSDKAFRDDYDRRMLSSLDIRQLSRDGRIRNPDEKPILVEASAPAAGPDAPVKVAGKHEKADVDLGNGNLSSHKTKVVEELHKSTEEPKKEASARQEKEYSIGVEKPQEKPMEVDSAKLKEVKREEEIAKTKLALERKKRLAEKATARASAKAQKEAEKKLKEKEKRAKKKNSALVPDAPAEQNESETKNEESEQAETPEEAPAQPNIKEQKEKVRYRSQSKGPEQLPRAILKRKKSQLYWIWAVPTAVAALLLVVLVYYSGSSETFFLYT